jgi:Na+-driven multidrug efflux pump
MLVESPPSAGVLARRIAALAGPTFAIAVLQSAGQLIETVLAARQGTLALAGWALVLPVTLLMQQMSAGAMGPLDTLNLQSHFTA